MFSDNSLLPKEAIRLAALGVVCERPQAYADVAQTVRHFASRIVGPSLELMGSSIEVLRTEGLIEAESAGEDAPLRITEAGRQELLALLLTSNRAPNSDVGRLAFALKMRFLHLLDPDDRHDQADMMIEACQAEIARLSDLEESCRDETGYFGDWLAHDIGLARARRHWLEAFRAGLNRAVPPDGGPWGLSDVLGKNPQ